MKLRPLQNQSSIQPQISKHEVIHSSETSRQDPPKIWEHPWNKHMLKFDAEKELDNRLKRPEPPTKEAIEKAKFVDKTYKWKPK